jgi:uncharacterized protein
MKLGRTYAAAVFTGLLIVATQSLAAGFDCAKAATAVEKRICANPELSQLDDQLAKAYKPEGNAADFERSIQRRWLKERNKCADDACLQAAYAERLRQLHRQPLNDADAISGDYGFGKGDGYQGFGYVVLLSPERLRYSYSITSGEPAWHTGEAYGEATLNGEQAVTVHGSGNCNLILRFKDGLLKTSYGKGNKETDCSTGARVTLDASFKKEN